MSLLATLGSLLLTPCLVPTDETNYAGQVIKISAHPHDLAVADVDGDFMPDVVIAAALDVLVNDGEGSLLLQTTPSGPLPWAVTAGDLDGDGRDEVLACSSNVKVLQGSVFGTLTVTDTDSLPTPGYDIVVGDLDGDGDLDVLAACLLAGAVVALLNDGTAHLSGLAPVPALTDAWDLAAADYDGDGRLDVAVTGSTSSKVDILLGTGGGGLVQGPPGPTVPQYSWVEAGDFDEDGRVDLGFGNSDGCGLLLGAGDGTFTAGATAAGDSTETVVVADVDQDGNLDLCQTHVRLGEVEVHRGDGTGALIETVPVSVEDDIHGAWFADIDLDGHTDLLAMDELSGTLVYIRGSGCGLPSNGVQLPGAWDVTAMRAADLSGDGQADLVLGEPGNVRVLHGDGHGGYASIAEVTVAAPSAHVGSLAVGDLWGDELPDVACTASDTDDVMILPGTGGGTLGAPVVLANDIYSSPDLAIGDANADGLLDLVGLDRYAHWLLVWRGKPGGGLMLPLTFPIPVEQWRLLLADFNEDGLLDAASVGTGLTLLPGAGGAVFGAGVPSLPGVTVWSANVADFDGDGHLDVVGQDTPLLQFAAGTGLGTFPLLKTATLPWNDQYLHGVADVDDDGADECVVSTSAGAVLYGYDGVKAVVEGVTPIQGYTRTSETVDADGDGDLDLVTGSYSVEYAFEDTHAIAVYPHVGPWHELGPGLPGAGWPALLGAGPPAAGGEITLQLCHGAPLAPTLLVMGFTPLAVPFKGGYLIPTPDVVIGPIAGTAQGSFELAFHWPVGVPAGLTIYLQAWLPDAAGPVGFSASEGLFTKTQ